MSTLYASDIANALADIANAGAAVTFSRTTNAYSRLTDTMVATPVSSSSYAIGVKSNFAKFAALGLQLNVPQTLLVAASGMTFTPQPGDAFTWGGFTYAVVSVETLNPDGTAILYTVIGNR